MAKRNCKKGYSCGASCISTRKACRKEFPDGISLSLDERAVMLAYPISVKSPADKFMEDGKRFLEGIPGMEEMDRKVSYAFDNLGYKEWKKLREQREEMVLKFLLQEGGSGNTQPPVKTELPPSWYKIAYPNIRTMTDSEEDKALGAASSFTELLGGPGFVKKPIHFVHTDPRAWANNGFPPVINIGDNKPTTIFHELGHLWEDNNPTIRKAAVDFIDKRRFSEELRPLGAGYREDEVAYPGDFLHPYMGKYYEDGSTEVISMGIQHFASATEMALLRKEDPGMYNMMIGLILHQRKKGG